MKLGTGARSMVEQSENLEKLVGHLMPDFYKEHPELDPNREEEKAVENDSPLEEFS